MCGIAGFIDFECETDKSTLSNMISVLNHRGPDDDGLKYLELPNAHVGLAHKRLSILDLSNNGHQPYCFLNYIMVYNGEVYNFKEIREELKLAGYTFESNSDTEVVIKAFHYWGEESVSKFNGMFSIAIFDTEIEVLFLIRDRAGVKPLYWYFHDELFMFSSELKSFHQNPSFNRAISQESVSLYLKNGYVPQPLCIFKYAKKLESSHVLRFNLSNRKVSSDGYWDIHDYYSSEKLDLTEDEALRQLDEIINSSIEYRMISDVPIGSFLSGGYDSSLVTAIMKKHSDEKVKTFTIGFENSKFDESSYAKSVAHYLDTEHTEYICSENDALDIIPMLPEIWDEPMADSSVIPTLIVSKLAKQKVSVSLSADGGDELFAGYNAYRQSMAVYSKIKFIPFRKVIANAMRSICVLFPARFNKPCRRISRVADILACDNVLDIYNTMSCTFLEHEITKLLKFKSEKRSLEEERDNRIDKNSLDALLSCDFQTSHVDQLLVKVDRATMYYSLEGREPLLDFRLIEFASKLPEKYKVNNDLGKYLLKKLTHEYLPKEIMERPKMGFSIPISDWFKGRFKELVVEHLDEKTILEQNIFQVSEINKIRDGYLNGVNVNLKQLWNLIVFQMWYKRWA